MAHSSVHLKPFYLLINRKKGLHLSANRDKNLFKEVAISVNFCIFLGFQGDCKLLIALI